MQLGLGHALEEVADLLPDILPDLIAYAPIVTHSNPIVRQRTAPERT
jgi:hypothetical protein